MKQKGKSKASRKEGPRIEIRSLFNPERKPIVIKPLDIDGPLRYNASHHPAFKKDLKKIRVGPRGDIYLERKRMRVETITPNRVGLKSADEKDISMRDLRGGSLIELLEHAQTISLYPDLMFQIYCWGGTAGMRLVERDTKNARNVKVGAILGNAGEFFLKVETHPPIADTVPFDFLMANHNDGYAVNELGELTPQIDLLNLAKILVEKLNFKAMGIDQASDAGATGQLYFTREDMTVAVRGIKVGSSSPTQTGFVPSGTVIYHLIGYGNQIPKLEREYAEIKVCEG